MKRSLHVWSMALLCAILSPAIAQNEYSEPSNAGASGSNNVSIGHLAGSSGNYNTMVGYAAGDVISSSYNSFFGAQSGLVSTGTHNSLFGYRSGYSLTTGAYNTFLGSSAGFNTTTSDYNIFVGYYSGYDNSTGGSNLFMGYHAGRNNETGSGNIYLGHQSGYNNITGGNNVFLGYQAGYNETGSNKLYIENTTSSTPLIYGDFTANKVSINIAPVSTHTLSVGGTIHATGIFVNGSEISGTWTKTASDVSYVGGNVSIGTTNPQGYKLAVAGKMISEEVVIKLQNAWPDYVFEPSYELMKLSDVEQYIKKNNHLPDVPAAAEIQKEGLEVGEMNIILLKKVEELTLYIIELEKRLQAVEKK